MYLVNLEGLWCLPGETRGGRKLKEIYRILDMRNENGAG
jgi:hypothetical protein